MALGVDEGPDMIVLELAIMVSGFHFLPFDVGQPPGRLLGRAYMLFVVCFVRW